MKTQITYLLKLHSEGRLSDNALDNALKALEPEPKATALDNLHKRSRETKKRKRNQIEPETKEIKEIKPTKLELVDNPKCGQFKAYDQSGSKYKDPHIMLADKRLIMEKQITTSLKEYKALKFQISILVDFFKDDAKERKTGTGVFNSDQYTILDPS